MSMDDEVTPTFDLKYTLFLSLTSSIFHSPSPSLYQITFLSLKHTGLYNLKPRTGKYTLKQSSHLRFFSFSLDDMIDSVYKVILISKPGTFKYVEI